MTPNDTAPQVHNNTGASRYEVRIGDEVAGFIDYAISDGTAEFIHTEILPAFEGRGLGSQLAKAALDDAGRGGLLVKPTCPFIAGYVSRHPEYASAVVAQEP